MEDPQKSTLMFVAGLIGAGKSKLVEGLQSILKDSNIVPEPIDKLVLGNFLEQKTIYDVTPEVNKHKYVSSTHSFQMAMLSLRYAKLVVALSQDSKFVISDQGLLFDTAFAEEHSPLWTEEERECYQMNYECANKRVRKLCSNVIVIYLNESVETCTARIKERELRGERKGEVKAYNKTYLTNLKTIMDKLITKLEKDGSTTVIRLTIPNVPAEEYTSKILNLIQTSLKSIF